MLSDFLIAKELYNYGPMYLGLWTSDYESWASIPNNLRKLINVNLANERFFVFNIGALSIYRNGKLHNPNENYRSKLLQFPGSTNGLIILGQDTDDRSVPYGIQDQYRGFQGWISHFMLWHRALTDSDIQQAYGRTPPVDNAIASWDQWKTKARGKTIRVVRFRKSRS